MGRPGEEPPPPKVKTPTKRERTEPPSGDSLKSVYLLAQASKDREEALVEIIKTISKTRSDRQRLPFNNSDTTF